MRALVVEDDAALRGQLVAELESRGFAVDSAADGREGQFWGEEVDYDVAVIDLGLPEVDGISLIRHLRAGDRAFPILILTARSNWQDKVEGLQAGADDYLVKPFHVEELAARLNALLRRSKGFASATVEVNGIILDTAARAVVVDGTAVELTAYEYKVLEYLMLHPGQVVSKTELTEHIYAEDFDRDSNVIEVFVTRLRRKLDPDGVRKPIQTLRGQGYRFADG